MPEKEQEYETVPAPGPCIDCPFYNTHEDQFTNPEPWCTRFQLTPLCGGDVNRCDVGFYAPDPRDGYK